MRHSVSDCPAPRLTQNSEVTTFVALAGGDVSLTDCSVTHIVNDMTIVSVTAVIT